MLDLMTDLTYVPLPTEVLTKVTTHEGQLVVLFVPSQPVGAPLDFPNPEAPLGRLLAKKHACMHPDK